MSFDISIDDYFSPEGPLAKHIAGFTARPQQIELAQAVMDTIQAQGTLIAEAGTGTGKTFAYLIPTLAHGGKVLVSTGTKTLQDQLFGRDVPAVKKALALPIHVALLKGRGNYVCHHHLEHALLDAKLSSRQEASQLQEIALFAKRSKTGDRADLSSVPEQADVWTRATSSRDNCLGSDCSYWQDCFVNKARREALAADVVVVNHALFLADLALRDEGITDLLPAADTIVFDEAHQLPMAATRFLGESISSHQLFEFTKDALRAGVTHAKESADWLEHTQKIDLLIRELRLACIEVEAMPSQRCSYQLLPNQDQFHDLIFSLIKSIDYLGKMMSALAERHPEIANISKRAPELMTVLGGWLPEPAVNTTSPDATEVDASVASKAAQAHASSQGSDQWVRWIEHSAQSLRLHAAPLSVADIFMQHRQKGQSWIFTSATLSVNNNFNHFIHQLGLFNAKTATWESPFDYPNNSLLYVPQHLPDPSSPLFFNAFVDVLKTLLTVNQGCALVLCTTLRAVDRVADALSQASEELKWEFPIYRQGERSKRDLLDRFRQSKNGVLVGSASFWEGVDIPGDSLSLVVIDKLPFAPPDDPVMEARIQASKRKGGSPFFEYQIPEAAMTLKQGAGRLIRTESDWGVLMVADQRLVDKPYGRLLWRGLPPFKRTRLIDDVKSFILEHKPST